jgi:CDP-diacylglycerol--glycerol-3-phosphate 3-phosphatidyltransferase
MTRRGFVQWLTASRLLFAAVVAVLTLWSGECRAALWASFALVLLIDLTDLLDGHLARRWGVVTDFGKFFDPYADAASRLTVFWAASQLGFCWTLVPLVLAVRDLTVAYVRVALSKTGGDVSARWTGKLKAWVHAVCGAFCFGAPLLFGTEVSEAAVVPVSLLVIAATLMAMIHHLLAACGAIRGLLR